MAEPIKHDMESSVATTAMEAGKWALIGALALPVLAGGTVAVIGGLSSAAILAGVIVGAATAVFAPMVATLGLIGGAFGAMKGGARVNADGRLYHDRKEALANAHAHKTETKITDAEIRGGQAVYPIAYEDGQRSIVNAIQQKMQERLQTQSIQTSMTSASGVEQGVPPGAIAMATAEAKCECGPNTKKVLDERAAVAAAAAGAGVQLT